MYNRKMLHGSHRIKVYKKKHHVVIALAVLLLPLLLIALLGGIARVNTIALGDALGLSFFRLIVSYLISLIVGIALAVAFGSGRFGESLVPVFDVLQNIPSFALIPAFALAFGYTDTMVIIFAATSIVWPILFYVLSAIHAARTELNDAATVFGARGWRRIIYYLIPLSFPAILTGSIVGISIGWEAVIGIEIIGLGSGIGAYLGEASRGGIHAPFIAGIAALLFLVFALNKLVWMPLLKQTRAYAE